MQLAFSTNAYLNYSFAEAVRRLAAIGYQGVEIMADVPHAWPAFLLPEQKQALRDALARNRLAISNVNAFMMHAVNDPRQRYWHPSWIEPDRHYRQIRIDHTTRALTLARETRRPLHHHGAGRPRRAGRLVVGGAEALRRDDQAGRRPRREGRRPAAGRAGAGPADRDGRPVPGVHAAHRLAGRRHELRRGPCLLRQRRPGDDHPARGEVHPPLPPRRHRRRRASTSTSSPATAPSTSTP